MDSNKSDLNDIKEAFNLISYHMILLNCVTSQIYFKAQMSSYTSQSNSIISDLIFKLRIKVSEYQLL